MASLIIFPIVIVAIVGTSMYFNVYKPQITCGVGEYDSEKNSCVFDVKELTEVKELKVEGICKQGEFNEKTGKCEIHPEKEAICDIGSYNQTTGKCETYPEKEYICNEGTLEDRNGTLKCVIKLDIIEQERTENCGDDICGDLRAKPSLWGQGCC